MGDFAKYGSRAQNDNENEFFDPKLVQQTSVRFCIQPIENFLKFIFCLKSQGISSIRKALKGIMHKKTLIKNSIKKLKKLENLVSFSKSSNHTNIMETSFGHAFFISEHIRAIRAAQSLIFDIFQKSFKFLILS